MTLAAPLVQRAVDDTQAPSAADTSSGELLQDPDCDVCAHPAAGHDAVAQRFCSATHARVLTRGCICRST